MTPLLPRSPRPRRAVSALALALCLGACSSSTDDAPTELAAPDRVPTPTEALETFLLGRIDASSVQGWRCISVSRSEPLGYVLLGRGVVPGLAPRARAGLKLDPEADSGEDRSAFVWTPTSATTARLQDRFRGTQVEWSDIEFTDVHRMSVHSSEHGALGCDRTEIPRS